MKKVGWIGTGVMGHPMAGHLIKAGYDLTVFTRTKSKAKDLLDAGAKWANSPQEAAEDKDFVCTMVGFPDELREVVFGKEGIINTIKKGAIFIDFTTSKPSLAIEIAKALKEKGVFSLDAPVSGGDVGARNATLSIMVGGEKEAFETARPLLEKLGKTIILQGGPGAGQHTKMCNQIQIAGTMIGMVEALLYGTKAGLDLETMLKSISGGAAACWSLDNLAPRILKGDMEPGFFVDHFVKDMAIALEEAQRMQISLPGLALVHQLYVSVQALGAGKKGTQALYLALKHMAGMD
ncbi:NAD(P)-dependent oxidoreductase [Candidatus Aerophobetes bacterium]|uniref:NAD(P)-dependent oxidoreductase n=1 Tax=Aerophobetes bacterium TaxID=2030807 RepID=A0A7V5LZB3_UNCAE|nr:NAD(P)-dependent oxidoreductase [Candidatus Aerophobetes bacterium]HHF98896.1 NAD(P)-dependent oxidoreductase [Candidatus Aerophobetes bacterium]